MEPRTSKRSNSTETGTTPAGPAGRIIEDGSTRGSATPSPLPEVTVFAFDSSNVPRQHPLCILVDIPEEERRRTTRLYNRMSRGELQPTQDSSSVQ